MIEQAQLTDFTRDIPRGENLQLYVTQYCQNRDLLKARADEFGLNRDYLSDDKPVTVGPFVSPAPLPTTFAGDPMRVRFSIGVAQAISAILKREGLRAKPNLVIPLEISEIPIKGAEAINALIVPKNKTEDQRVALIGKTEKGTAYGATTLSLKDLKSTLKTLRDTFPIFMDRFPYLRRQNEGRRLGDQILGATISDLELAFTEVAQGDSFSQDAAVNYLLFAAALNRQIARRLYPGVEFSIEPVDTTIYDDFMRNGISDITTFTRKLQKLGVFDDDPGYIKTVSSNGKTRILKLTAIQDDDVLLEYVDTQETVSYSDLLKQPNKIAPCKSVSYILCFGNFAPVIYGDDNWGNKVYEPYAKAKQQLTTLGLAPVMYRIQPQIPNGYQEATTVFDFYGKLLQIV